MAKIVVNFSIEEDTMERLRALHKKTEVPMSRIVEIAILKELKEREDGVKHVKRTTKRQQNDNKEQ